jgi:hypothetical protein
MTTMADPNSLAGLAQQTLQQQQQEFLPDGASVTNYPSDLTAWAGAQQPQHYLHPQLLNPVRPAKVQPRNRLNPQQPDQRNLSPAEQQQALQNRQQALTAAQQPQQQTQLPGLDFRAQAEQLQRGQTGPQSFNQDQQQPPTLSSYGQASGLQNPKSPFIEGGRTTGFPSQDRFLNGQQSPLNGPQSFNQQQPPTLPPQIGQQKFGNSGIGSLGGSGGQSNVSLNLQGSATMNPQGANQNRGYPGFDFNPGASGAGASGQMRLAEGGAIPAPAQQSRGIAALGRGGDTQLVHMTPGEVRGLQQLALAHGGSLTINPHTGLVEAGFLSSMLPMLIGAALTATGVGAPVAALMVGGGYGVATGDLKKGLMAGLGAYGGANLGAGLGEMGAEALATTPEAYATTLGVEGAGAGSQAAMLAEQTKNFGLQGLQATAEGAIPNSSIQLPKFADMDMAQRAGLCRRG